MHAAQVRYSPLKAEWQVHGRWTQESDMSMSVVQHMQHKGKVYHPQLHSCNYTLEGLIIPSTPPMPHAMNPLGQYMLCDIHAQGALHPPWCHAVDHSRTS